MEAKGYFGSTWKAIAEEFPNVSPFFYTAAPLATTITKTPDEAPSSHGEFPFHHNLLVQYPQMGRSANPPIIDKMDLER